MYFFENLRQFARTDRMAASLRGEELSFRQLDEESDALALWLEKYHQPRQTPVAIFGDKQNSLLCAMAGCIKGGHPYIFLPEYYPLPRLQQLVRESGAELIIVCSDAACPLTDMPDLRQLYANHTHPLAESVAEFMGQTAPEELCAGDDELWMICHTSGSTGKPKLVGISGRNIRAKVAYSGNIRRFFSGSQAQVVNLASFNFSMSLQCLFADLFSFGSELNAVDMSMLRNLATLPELLVERQFTTFGGTASLINRVMKSPLFSERQLPSLKVLALGGEPLPKQLVSDFFARFPHCELVNIFGSTETCIAPLSAFITPQLLEEHPDMDIMPIGVVADVGDAVKLVNEQGAPVADGEIGEFLFEGDFIVPGYLNDPQQTAEKFYTTADGKRGFRSGDLGYRKFGYYFFVGRANNMHKIGGYRVEMEDVENALRQVGIVQNAAVVPVMQGGNAMMLAAYVVLNERGAEMKKLAATLEIKRRMAELRPDYMIPQKLVFVDALPVNANNKLDRQVLIDRERLG